MVRKRIFYYLLTLLCILEINAQDEKFLTLKKCIDYALQYNIEINMWQNDINTATLQRKDLYLQSIPNINLSTSVNYNAGKTLNPYNNDYEFAPIGTQSSSINGSFILFDGLNNFYSIKKSIVAKDIACLRYEDNISELKKNIAGLFLEILLKNELLGNNSEKLEIVDEEIENTSLLVKNGKVNNNVLLRIQAQKLDLLHEKKQNESDINTLKFYLSKQMNFSGSLDELRIAYDKINIENLELWFHVNRTDSLVNNLQEIHPRILIKKKTIIIDKYTLKQTHWSLLPKLSLNAGYSTNYSTFAADSILIPNTNDLWQKNSYQNQLNNNLSRYIGLKLQWTFNDCFKHRNLVARTKINIDNNKTNLLLEDNSIEKEAYNLINEVKLLYDKIDLYEQEVALYKEVFRTTKEKYTVGVIALTEYFTIKNAYDQAEYLYTISKYNFLLKLTLLELTVGRTPQIL